MTRHEQLLAEAILGQIEGTSSEQAVALLLDKGLLNRRACEQQVVHSQITRLGREGVPRCEAMHVTAQLLCCSYEKVRSLYYNHYKS